MKAPLILAALLPVAAQLRGSLMEDAGKDNLPSQKLGVDDLVAVSVYDAPELTRTVRVEADGTIHLPLLKDGVKAAGLFPRELEASVAVALEDRADPGGPGGENHRGRVSQPADRRDGRGEDAGDVSSGGRGDAAGRAGARRGPDRSTPAPKLW